MAETEIKEDSPENLKLLEEITNEELESLECPTYETQESAWRRILTNLTRERVGFLLYALGYELIDWRFHNKSNGVINRIYFLDVKKAVNKEEWKRSGDYEQFVLRVYNPHSFWENGRSENEIAVLKYVKENTTIPVPKIISYSIDKSSSLIGCQYILMERVSGVVLRELIDPIDNVNHVPQKIIDQMLDYVRVLQDLSPPNMDSTRICFFDLKMRPARILQDGPPIEPCTNYLEFIDQQLCWCVKEMRKMRKYVELANELDKVRQELIDVVAENADLDKLNFGDQMSISHGDLNHANILIDPRSYDVTGLIDWDFCSHGFDCYRLGFFTDWFDRAELREAMKKRIDDEINSNRLEWLRPQRGLKFRKYLFALVSDANQLGFYSSTWFYDWKNPNVAVRVHINTHAGFVREGLKLWPEILLELKNYRNAFVSTQSF